MLMWHAMCNTVSWFPSAGEDLGAGGARRAAVPPFCWTPDLVDWAIWTILCFGRFNVLAVV